MLVGNLGLNPRPICVWRKLFESKTKAFQLMQTHVETRDVVALVTKKTLSSNAYTCEKI